VKRMRKKAPALFKRVSNKNSLAVAVTLATILFMLFILVIKLGTYLQDLQTKTEKLTQYKEVYQAFAGFQATQNTLLVLANNSEIRTGGGFIGTVGLIH